MKNIRTIVLQVLIGILPLLFLYSIWDSLPEKVPTHYNSRFEPDAFGSKLELSTMLAFLFIAGLFATFLLKNINKIDPKNKYQENHPLMQKLAWVLIIFISAIGIYLVYQAQEYSAGEKSSPRILIGVIALSFAMLGNYMNTLKPNYFVGIRTPWNLENEENWRRTHFIASRLWFFGGILLLIATLLVSTNILLPLLLTMIIPLTLIPVIYSYKFFREKKHKN